MDKKHGFTIIELTLAMAFISVLLLSVVFVSIQVGQMYNRGITLRSVNTSGRDIEAILRQDFLQTDSRQVAGSGENAVIWVSEGGEAINGRICLGRYSYIWNSPRVLDEARSGSGVVTLNGEPINFIRVIDENGALCVPQEGAYTNTLTDTANTTQLLKTASGSEVVMAIHDMSVTRVATVADSPEGLFRIQFVVGTNKMSEILTSDQSCKAPIDGESNIEFCAINQFEAIVRTNG